MKSKAGLLIILFAFAAHLRAQGVEIGLRAEMTGLHLSYSDGYEQFSPTLLPNCFELTFGIFPFKKLGLEFRGGSAFSLSDEDYRGLEYGVILKYYFAKRFYLAAGAAGHSNSGGGGHNFGGRSESSWIGPAFGLGVKPWEEVGFELIYQGANDSPISYVPSPNGLESGVTKKVSWVIKLGVAFSWMI